MDQTSVEWKKVNVSSTFIESIFRSGLTLRQFLRLFLSQILKTNKGYTYFTARQTKVNWTLDLNLIFFNSFSAYYIKMYSLTFEKPVLITGVISIELNID